MTEYPSWWAVGVRVVSEGGQPGTITKYPGGSWAVSLDGQGEQQYIVNPVPDLWTPEVKTGLTRAQHARIVYDAEVALCRAFGIHYAPYWEALPETVRVEHAVTPKVTGRDDLNGIRNVIRGLVRRGLAPYVVE